MTLDHVRPLYPPYTFISPLTMSPDEDLAQNTQQEESSAKREDS